MDETGFIHQEMQRDQAAQSFGAQSGSGISSINRIGRRGQFSIPRTAHRPNNPAGRRLGSEQPSP
jgi:hypothetical protein